MWTNEKRRRKSEEKVREEKRGEEQVRESQKKEDAGARQGKKVSKHCVSSIALWLGRVQVGLLKRRVRSQLAE